MEDHIVSVMSFASASYVDFIDAIVYYRMKCHLCVLEHFLFLS